MPNGVSANGISQGAAVKTAFQRLAPAVSAPHPHGVEADQPDPPDPVGHDPLALNDLAAYSDHPSAFLALNRGTQHFRAKTASPGFIAYRETGRFLFQLGSVFAPAESRAALLREFCSKAKAENRLICALQLRMEDIPVYEQFGFHVNQLGLSYTLDLTRFKTAGTRFMKMRNKIARARNSNIKIVELGVEVPRTRPIWDQLISVTESWLSSKGRHVKQLEFMIGEVGDPENRLRRVFAAMDGDRLIGFICYVPSYGRYRGYMHDLSRRASGALPGVMEYINISAIERFKTEGATHLNFGFTPFVGLSEATDCASGRSRTVSWVLGILAKHGKAVYPAKSQADYKMKWSPQIVEPEYLAFQGRFRFGYLWKLLLLTRAI